MHLTNDRIVLYLGYNNPDDSFSNFSFLSHSHDQKNRNRARSFFVTLTILLQRIFRR